MSIYSSGSKWKNAARGALASAQALEDQQRDVEFQRSLLSNIRQQRLAQAQLSLMNYSDSFTSSSAAGASANIDSTLAGELGYSFETSQRMEEIQDYQQAAQQYMKKYAKQQKTRAAAFSVAAIAGTALTGGVLGVMGAAGTAAAGGSALAQFGAGAWTALGTYGSVAQGAAQILSGTGQTETGISNIISGVSQAYQALEYENDYARLLDRLTPKKFELTSIDPKTGKPIQGSTVTTTYTPGSLSYLNQNIFN